jgi:hypothetical protein
MMKKQAFAKSRIILAVAALVSVFATRPFDPGLAAQQPAGLSPEGMAQMAALLAEKASRTPAQLKMDSQLIDAAKMARGERIVSGLSTLGVTVSDANAQGVVVDVRANVTDGLLDQMRALGAEVLEVSAAYRHIRIRVALTQIEAIAGLPDVVYVQPKQEPVTSRTRIGSRQTMQGEPGDIGELRRQKQIERADVITSVQRAIEDGGIVTSIGIKNSEGDATHRAALARATYGVSGAGVRIGVISDGVTHLAASRISGDLGAVTVLPGQEGNGDEGTEMLEIIHDLAPDAQLYFATGFGSLSGFAQNIRNLQAAGCTIIVDDVGYPYESPFQDGQVGTSPTNGGILAQAVKDVAAAGVLYFSAAGNNGNQNDGTSATWEGDFVDGGAVQIEGTPGRIHNFGGLNYNPLHITPTEVDTLSLFWADPLGASANDYDLFVFNSAGTVVLGHSMNRQNGTQDPYESIKGNFARDMLVVVVKVSGNARFLHVDMVHNAFHFSTSGGTRGHAATTAPNSFGVAATPAQTPGPYPSAFGVFNKIETFSSDGPRRIFFAANGTPLTPGNFSSTGGQVLQKPDFTAADGVSVTGAGGVQPTFYGTSAAAPHAAAIAALVKSRNMNQTATQVRTALFSSAVDIEAAGIDRDSGVGIIMADTAVAAVATVNGAPAITTHPSDQFVAAGLSAQFTVAAIGTPALAYRWQVLANMGTSWSDVQPSFNFSGTTTSTLTVRAAGFFFRNMFRAIVTNAAGAATSNAAMLIVHSPSVDMDRDGKADLTLFRPSSGTWFFRNSGNGSGPSSSRQFGLPGDVPVPGDYEGDTQLDPAVYRPSTREWYVLQSSTNTTVKYTLGLGRDLPVPGDYDGDGRPDLAVYHRSTGVWTILTSSTNYATTATLQLGIGGDIPVPSDYDGDGKTDLAVFRPSIGTWIVLTSSSGSTSTLSLQWGLSGDVPVPGDYDGDGKTDAAVYRGSTGTWYILQSTRAFTTSMSFQWGLSGDIPVPSDYDGDGKTDLAVYRPSGGMWFIEQSSTSYATPVSFQWGLGGDIPAANASIAQAMAASPLATLVQASDLDGDGKADLTLFRPSSGTWFSLRSSTAFTASTVFPLGVSSDLPVTGDFDGDGRTDAGVYTPATGAWSIVRSSLGALTYQWGLPGDVQVPGDYDGDGKTDLAVYRGASGTWFIRQSSTNFTTTVSFQWGLSGDVTVPGDYDGDGVTDLAVWRPSTGTWYIRLSSTGYATSVAFQWGIGGDITVPGDYDGDGKTDLGVFRPSTGTWFIRQSSTGYATSVTVPWGLSADTPVPGDFDGDGKTDIAIFRPSTGTWFLLRSSTNFTTSSSVAWGLAGDIPILKRP